MRIVRSHVSSEQHTWCDHLSPAFKLENQVSNIAHCFSLPKHLLVFSSCAFFQQVIHFFINKRLPCAKLNFIIFLDLNDPGLEYAPSLQYIPKPRLKLICYLCHIHKPVLFSSNLNCHSLAWSERAESAFNQRANTVLMFFFQKPETMSLIELSYIDSLD